VKSAVVPIARTSALDRAHVKTTGMCRMKRTSDSNVEVARGSAGQRAHGSAAGGVARRCDVDDDAA
jgi:hypothetical protein